VSEAKTRARFIAAVNALASTGNEHFTLKELYSESGLTKKDFRRVFGTKAALINAAWEMNTSAGVAATRARGRAKQHVGNDQWMERRFRILERAISSLEIQILEVRKKSKKDTVPSITPTLPGQSLPSPVQAQILAPNYGQTQPAENLKYELESPNVGTPNNNSLEPPPFVTETVDVGIEEIDSYWQVATEQVKSHPHKTLIVLLFAIIVGVFIGILTSTIHAGAEIPKTQVGNDRASSRNVGPPNLRVLTDRALAGDLAAQADLALMYARGDGVEPNLSSAIRWAEPAASRGNADAQYLLGWVLQEGIKPDLALAAHWYAEAANRGNVKAMHNFAIALLTGLGVKKDGVMASYWFERAANLGYRDSEFDLAVLYERGDGVTQSPFMALHWYEKAARAGDAEAAKRARLLKENVPALTIGP
jgi:TPR repeat protein